MATTRCTSTATDLRLGPTGLAWLLSALLAVACSASPTDRADTLADTDARVVDTSLHEAVDGTPPDHAATDVPAPSDVEGPDAAPDEPEVSPATQPFKVMSFNLRYGLADDGADAWKHRQAIVKAFLQAEAPDLLGVQEGLIFQLKAVGQALPDHDWVGTDRSGTGFDEYSAIFYDRLRFELVASGTFWLSDTPDMVASRFSEAQLFPRVVTWAHLRERASGQALFSFNTHFDTTEADAVPERSAALIVQKLAELAGELPVVLTGDFNESVGEPAYRILVGTLDRAGVTGTLRDPWPELGLPEEGSFHGFSGTADVDRRIDWILHSDGLTAMEAVVSHYQEGGHYPSDHFPVWASMVATASSSASFAKGLGRK